MVHLVQGGPLLRRRMLFLVRQHSVPVAIAFLEVRLVEGYFGLTLALEPAVKIIMEAKISENTNTTHSAIPTGLQKMQKTRGDPGPVWVWAQGFKLYETLGWAHLTWAQNQTKTTRLAQLCLYVTYMFAILHWPMPVCYVCIYIYMYVCVDLQPWITPFTLAHLTWAQHQ